MGVFKMNCLGPCLRDCECPPLYIISTYASATVLAGIIFYVALIHFYDFDELLPECQRKNVRDSLQKRAYVLFVAMLVVASTLSILRSIVH